ncbi:MAG: tail fiber domain-containing protein [Phycisphaerales bacterium]|nr:tail fiber domain-containing protein [Phycisphaerales bacterium]
MLKRLLLPIIAASSVLVLAQSSARAQTFSNATPLSVPLNETTANLYPSVITVPSGALAGNTVQRVAVTINGINHTWCSDIRIVLVSPGGQAIALLNGNFGSGDAVNTTATFFAEATTAPATTSTNFVSGVYLTTSSVNFSAPSPAPGGPYNATLSSLTGTQANGNWQLFVSDSFAPADPLVITGGWSIEFLPAATSQSNAFTYQGKLENAPSSSTANFRFSVWENPTSTSEALRIGNISTVNAVAVQNGLFSASVDIGRQLKTDRAQWLQIEVESPPGSGFVTLSPRQPLTPAPQARIATTATSAVTANSVPWTGITGVPANVSNAFSPWDAGTNQISYSLGRVGIGTPSPSANLHVFSGITFDQVLFDSGSGFGTWLAIRNGAIDGRTWQLVSTGPSNTELAGAFLIRDGTSAAVRMTFLPNGNIGLGTITPTFPLHLVTNSDTQIALTGGPATGGNAAARTWSIQSSSTNSPPGSQLNGSFQIVDRSAGAARMLIDANGNVGIGTTSPSQRLTVAGNVLANNVAVPSSGRFKHNVAPITDALDKLLKLEGVSFDWNPDFAKDRPGREHDIGFVAEEVAKVFPEVVFYDAEGKVTGMDYSRLTAVAIQAIKQQQAKFESELAKRDAENTELKARLDRLEQLLKEPRPTLR